jgi:hypothetical protein
MKKPLLILWLTSLVFLVALIGTYGYLNDFVFDGLFNPLWLLLNLFLPFVMDFMTTYNLQSTTTMIVIGGAALGFFLGLIALVRGLMNRRIILGILSALSVTALFVFGVSLIIVTPDLTQGRFIFYILDGFIADGVNTLFLLSLLGFGYLILFLTFLLGITSSKRTKGKPNSSTLTDLATALPPLNGQGQTQPNFTPTPSVQTAPPTNASDNLSELVKVVMAEELNLMRATQPLYPSPGYPQPMNVYPPIDVNTVRRIVAEELAKFQSHYISRPEVQTLIAQEMANLKAQLKLK